MLPTGLPATVDNVAMVGRIHRRRVPERPTVSGCAALDDRAREHYAALALRLFTQDDVVEAAPGRGRWTDTKDGSAACRGADLSADRRPDGPAPASNVGGTESATPLIMEAWCRPVVLGGARSAVPVLSREAVSGIT